MELNKGQRTAIDAIRSGRNVFLTGEGGTGKSAAIAKAVNLLRRDGRKTIICAPTGMAAQNVHGSTIHSAFRFDLAPKVADKLEALQPSKVVQEADAIIVVEVGMVRRDLMDAIARAVEIENERRDNDPELRHLQLVVVDFSQLPPVATKADKPALVAQYGHDSADSGLYAFESDGWERMGFEVCQLTEAMRQSDPTFIAMLNRARIGDASCLPYFNRLAGRGEAPSEAVSLVGTNRAAEMANAARLEALRGEERVFDGNVSGKFRPSDMATQQSLALKAGAHVMTLVNDADAGYVNGSTGTVAGFGAADAGGEPLIAVRLDGSRVIVNVRRHTWENVEYRVSERGGRKFLDQETVGEFSQYPLKLAWAVTFHKSQGQTLGSVCIDPSTFAPGQLYVGLSRATSASGIWLKRPIKERDLTADRAVVEFYEQACGWSAPEKATGGEVPDLTARPTTGGRPREKRKAGNSADSHIAAASNGNEKMPANLGQVQDELHHLLSSGGRTWVRVYELISHVAEKGLYRPDFKSFSVWIRAEAEREGVAESILWHRKSAGDFYMEWASDKDDAPTLADGKRLSEDNLNLVRKIAKVDAERGDELMKQMVVGGLSTKELRREWREHRRKTRGEGMCAGDEPAAFRPRPCRANAAKLSLACPDANTFACAIEALRAAGIKVEEIN